LLFFTRTPFASILRINNKYNFKQILFLNTTGTSALGESFPEEESQSEVGLPPESIRFAGSSLSSPPFPKLAPKGWQFSASLTDRAIAPSWSQHWHVWFATLFLVSAPVFFEAPLVRFAPWLSIVLTVGWLSISRQLREDVKTQVWGSLLWGFSLTWLCGAIYWGWLRSEPSWHLPIEAIALPWAIWAVSPSLRIQPTTQKPPAAKSQTQDSQYQIGGWFYLGSLFGTCVTDFYFYQVNLFPHWRSLMRVESDPSLVQPIFQSALAQVQTSWGMAWAFGLAAILLFLGIRAMRSPQLCFWAFGGAVFGTIFVDALFAVLAYFA
jgi:hypothetical protein